MTKLLDVNPFRKSEGGEMSETMSGEMPSKSRFRRLVPSTAKGWIILLLIILLLWKLGIATGIFPSLTFPAVDKGKWQAVFLAGGQVYFGHLKEINREYVALKDTYYLRVSQQLQPPSQQPQTSINLVKLGGELHAPEDTMYIPKGQIQFWENMKIDSAVTQAIEQLQKQEQ